LSPAAAHTAAEPKPAAAAPSIAPSPEKDKARAATPSEEERLPEEKAEKAKEGDQHKQAGMGSVLRVDSKRIDHLLNLVCEAVINKATFNQISTQFSETQNILQSTDTVFKDRLKELFDSLPDYLMEIQKGKSVKEIKREISEKYSDLYEILDPFQVQLKGAITKFRSTSQNLGRITSELHERVLQIRMVPISQIFSRFPRLVRDVSKSLNKQVKLVIEGEDTELDKSVIEDLLDPLIHCVRNSVDHGIETPDERVKKGKPEEGCVLLKAKNEGNMIIIEVADDGKGIDVNAVKAKAVERGIIHPSKNLSDIEAFNLIFEAGFSTAKTVTNISGRGVGLDVVRKQIEKLNGNVSVWSEPDRGTRLTIKIPLTLAIIQGLLVRVGKEIYAIPIASVIDSHRIKPSEIKMIDNYEVFNVRNDVVSLIRLNRLFRIPSEDRKDYHFIVIVGSGDKRMGLMVDSLIGEEDVVIKPLRDRYTNSPGIAGATILGDGTVSLIIDVSQLLDLGLKREIEDRKKRAAEIL
jgi:two-component system chemotaxis sensor kinase CheA